MSEHRPPAPTTPTAPQDEPWAELRTHYLMRPDLGRRLAGDAAVTLVHLLRAMRARQISGVRLKDDRLLLDGS
jgi:ethanolamine ammonia-lyase small subunit